MIKEVTCCRKCSYANALDKIKDEYAPTGEYRSPIHGEYYLDYLHKPTRCCVLTAVKPRIILVRLPAILVEVTMAQVCKKFGANVKIIKELE